MTGLLLRLISMIQIGMTYRLDGELLRCKKFDGEIGVFHVVDEQGNEVSYRKPNGFMFYGTRIVCDRINEMVAV